MQRTEWAERFLEKFAAAPLTWENVFRAPAYADGTDKEVVDLLLVLRNKGIFVSMKCQQYPLSRCGERLESWVRKHAQAALKQVGGGIRTSRTKDFWCIHKRRGRVDFKANHIMPVRALVVVETFTPVELDKSIPLEIKGVPISYLSVNDFLNLILQLRTINDLLRYLDVRSSLPHSLQRTIGSEMGLFRYFLLRGGFLTSSDTAEGIEAQVKAQEDQIEELLKQKKVADSEAEIVERLSNDLSKRLENYADGLDEDTIRRFDSASSRSNYLLIQEELCDLVLDERRKIGLCLSAAIEKVRTEDTGMLYQLAYLDSKPDFLYILSSTVKVARSDILNRGQDLLLAGLSCYGKRRGMFVNYTQERDGFEVVFVPSFSDTEELRKHGKKIFSSLRIVDLPVGRI